MNLQIQQEKAYLDKIKEEFQQEKEMREDAEKKVWNPLYARSLVT